MREGRQVYRYMIEGAVSDGRFQPIYTVTKNVEMSAHAEFQWGDTDTGYWQNYVVGVMREAASKGLLTIEGFAKWWTDFGYNVTLYQYLDYLGIRRESLDRYFKAFNRRPDKITFGTLLAFFDREFIILTAIKDGTRISFNPRRPYTSSYKWMNITWAENPTGVFTAVNLDDHSVRSEMGMVCMAMSKIIMEVPLPKLKFAYSKINEIRNEIRNTLCWLPSFPNLEGYYRCIHTIYAPQIVPLIELGESLGIEIPISIT